MDDRLSSTEAARLAGVDSRTITRLCVSGELPAARLGARGHWKIRRADLEAYIKHNRGNDKEVPQKLMLGMSA